MIGSRVQEGADDSKERLGPEHERCDLESVNVAVRSVRDGPVRPQVTRQTTTPPSASDRRVVGGRGITPPDDPRSTVSALTGGVRGIGAGGSAITGWWRVWRLSRSPCWWCACGGGGRFIGEGRIGCIFVKCHRNPGCALTGMAFAEVF